MDLISKYSPSSSVSPPISPIKLFHQPSNNSLPPLKNLPVWNRPGLEKNRFIRSITKDSPELDKAELILNHLTSRSTQTSPPSTALNNSIGFNLAGKKQDGLNDKSSPITAEKRLYFVQTEHEVVLKKLHSEIERLKNDRKELNFKFVMTKNGISVSPDNADDTSVAREGSSSFLRKGSGTRKKSAANRVNSSSKDGFKNRRAIFKSGGTRNPVLESKQIHRMKSGSKSAKSSTTDQNKKNNLDNQQLLKFDKHEKLKQSSNNAQNFEENKNVMTQQPSSTLPNEEKKYSSEDYEEIIRGLQRMNARQANELSHLKDKLIEQREKPGPEQMNMHPENRLPKLATHSTIKSAKMPHAIREKHEILTLPALRPQKFGNRQRKANATHTQRQKINKEFVQKFA